MCFFRTPSIVADLSTDHTMMMIKYCTHNTNTETIPITDDVFFPKPRRRLRRGVQREPSRFVPRQRAEAFAGAFVAHRAQTPRAVFFFFF